MSIVKKYFCYVALNSFFFFNLALANDVDISGRWTGATLCPSGNVTFAIDVKGSTGTFTYSIQKNERNHPITVSSMKGWEGMWIYFYPSNSNYSGSFEAFNGLLSPNKKTLTVRAGVGIGDCRGFTLTRREIPNNQASKKLIGPPQNREPTEEEMRKAVEYSIHGDDASLEFNNSLSGVSATIDHFEKLNCEPHRSKPGYFCDYIMSTNVQFHSNEGTEAGNKHAQGVQMLYEMFRGNSNAQDTVLSGRFLYVKSKGRWMRFKD
jgi:hypothetical protein